MKFSCRRILLAVILAVVPASVSAAPSMGGLLIAESWNYNSPILVDLVSGEQSIPWAGGAPWQTFGIAVSDAGQVYVSVALPINPPAVVRIDPISGVPTTLSAGGAINGAVSLAVGPGGYVYAATYSSSSQIIRIDPSTGAQAIVATGLSNVNSIAVDRAGTLYACQLGSPYTVVAIDLVSGSRRTAISASEFFPKAVNLDATGRLYAVGDRVVNNQLFGTRIYRVEVPGGAAALIADLPYLAINSPHGIAIGPDGTIYVSGEEQNYGGPRTGVIYTVAPPDKVATFAISGYLGVPLQMVIYNPPPTPAIRGSWGQMKARYR